MRTNNLNPFTSVTDFKGIQIQDRITKFSYKFSEEEDDVCTMVIDSDDRQLADRPEYQEGKLLVVEFGYLGGVVGTKRTVFIFDTKTSYTQDGINLELTCHEKFALAKMDSVSNKNMRQLKKDTPIIFSPDVLSKLSLEIDKGNPELESLLKANKIDVKGVFSGNKKEDKVVTYYNGNLSTFQNLRMFLDRLPGGPYIIDSRDSSVTIRTRNFKQKPLVSYIYFGEGNQLLQFVPETKNRSTGSHTNKMKVTSWDRAKKSAVTHTIDSEDGSTVLAQGAPVSDWSDISDRNEPIKLPGFNYPERKKGALARIGVTEKMRATNDGKGSVEDYDGKPIVGKGTLPRDGQVAIKLFMGDDYGKTQSDGGYVARDNTAVYKPKFEILNDSPLPTKAIISTEPPEKAKAYAVNKRKDEELNNNPATAQMEGNPIIECGQLISITGVAHKHAGNYYIKACEHRIDEGGYITEISSMVRNGVNRKTTKITTSSRGVSKRNVNNEKGPNDPVQRRAVKVSSKKAGT